MKFTRAERSFHLKNKIKKKIYIIILAGCNTEKAQFSFLSKNKKQ